MFEALLRTAADAADDLPLQATARCSTLPLSNASAM